MEESSALDMSANVLSEGGPFKYQLAAGLADRDGDRVRGHEPIVGDQPASANVDQAR